MFALLLTIIVGGEVTDILPCADAGCGVWSVLLDTDAPQTDPGDEESDACLCQVTFVSTAILPDDPSGVTDGGALGAIEPPPAPVVPYRIPYPPPRI